MNRIVFFQLDDDSVVDVKASNMQEAANAIQEIGNPVAALGQIMVPNGSKCNSFVLKERN